MMRKFPKLLAVVLAIAIIICPAMCLSSMAESANTYSVSYADDAITVNVSAANGFLVALVRLDVLGYVVDEENVTVAANGIDGEAVSFEVAANPDFNADVLSLLIAAKEPENVELFSSVTVTIPAPQDEVAGRQYLALTEVQAADAGTAEAPESFLTFEGVGADGILETPVVVVDACAHLETTHESKAATCSVPGYEKDVCDACGEELNYVESPATGHIDEDGTDKCDLGCQTVLEYVDNGDGTHDANWADGQGTYHDNQAHIDDNTDALCDKCGAAIEVEDVCDHVIGEVTSAQPATATEVGKIYGICSACGEECEADVEYYGNFKTAYAAAELAGETSLLLSARNDRLAEKGTYDRAFIYFQHTLSSDGSNKITIKDIADTTDTTQGSNNRPCKTWKYGVKSLQYTEAVINNVFVYAGGQWYNGEQITYSLRSYIDERLAITSDADEKALYANLLAFGASMQNIKGYNLENLATDGLAQDILDLIVEGDATMTDAVVENKPNGDDAAYINKYGFDMADKVVAMLYFRTDRYTGANKDDYKIVASWTNARGADKEIVIRKEGSLEEADIYYTSELQNGAPRANRYTFNFDEFASYDFRQQVTFTFYDGEAMLSQYTASYEALVKGSIDGGAFTGDWVTVSHRLLHYSDAAKAFFCK